MKVALIDVNCKQSSTGKIVYDLYTELNKNGHEAAVYYGRGPKIKEHNIFKFGINLETFFHALMTRITGFTGIFSPISTHRLIKKLKFFKPDIVHIHELHAYFINLKPIMNYLKRAPIKVIWTFHCEFMFTGKCAITYGCDKWQTECNKCPQVKEYPKSLVFDFSNPMFRQKKDLFNDFDNLTIVTPPKWLENKVKLSFLRNKKIVVIPNGVNQEIFKNRNFEDLNIYKKTNSKIVFLSVASNIMTENKGGLRILELAKKLDSEKYMFILIGVKDKKKYITKSNVVLMEQTDDQYELAKYYSLATAYLIMSQSENFPTTCLESLSCGTPILGYDVGGVAETALKGFGYFTDFNKEDELIKIIQKTDFFESKKKLEFFNPYRHLHSVEKMNQNYIELYGNMANS